MEKDAAGIILFAGIGWLVYKKWLFHAINRLLPVVVNPYFLHAAMLEYTVEEGGEHLRMVVQKEGAFQYEEN